LEVLRRQGKELGGRLVKERRRELRISWILEGGWFFNYNVTIYCTGFVGLGQWFPQCYYVKSPTPVSLKY